MLLAVLPCVLNGCGHAHAVQTITETNTDGKGQSGEWTMEIAGGIAMATIRAINYENVSLRVVCGTDQIEKLIITTSINSADPIAANKLSGMQVPLQFYFDNHPALNLMSSVIADVTTPNMLGHQVVSATPSLLRELENSKELEIVNINESYKFILLGAESKIKGMKCLTSSADNDQLKLRTTTIIEVREGIAYIPNDPLPFTGLLQKFYTNGKKEQETNFKDGKANGMDTSWYENGQKQLEGNYKDGKKIDLITSWYENGQKQSEINIKDGKANGLTITWHKNGQKKGEANFKDDELNGLVTTWHENGQKEAEANYKDGKKNGLSTSWYDNGQKQLEINLKDDKQNGLGTHWYESGQKQAEGNYKDGKANGFATSWHENGQKQAEKNYKDDKENGLATHWYENGQKQAEANYKDGKENGLVTYWYKNGQKQSEVSYRNGEQNGLATFWYENGQKQVETNFKDGKVVEPEKSSVEDNWRTLCSTIALLAEKTMAARQAGTAMIKLMEAAQTNELIANELAENMIIAAYEIDRYASVKLQQRTVEEFRDKAYLNCFIAHKL